MDTALFARLGCCGVDGRMGIGHHVSRVSQGRNLVQCVHPPPSSSSWCGLYHEENFWLRS